MAAPLLAELLGGTPSSASSPRWRSRRSSPWSPGSRWPAPRALSHDIFVHVVRTRGRRPSGSRCASRASRRSPSARSAVDPRHRLQGAERRVHGRPGVRRRRQREFSGAAALDRLAPLHHARRGRRDRSPARLSSVALIFFSPTIWVDILHHPHPVFPLRNPAIVSMPLGFLCGVVASLVGREPLAEARFDDEKLRTYLGIGAE